MTERIQYLLEIHEAEETDDLEKKLDHLNILTGSLFTLTQSLFDSKEKIQYFQRELENKYFRFGLVNQSLLNLLKGNKFTLIGHEVIITDLFSIFSLTRMQIESYTIMFYLFFEKISDEEKNLRYDVYQLHGLKKQSMFKTITEDGSEKRKNILRDIEKIENSIKKNELFKIASEKEKTKFLNPNYAKLINTEKLIEKSGLKSSRFFDLWSLYSNYAHGEHISDRQHNYIYKENKSTLKESILIVTLNSILSAKLCSLIADSFQGVKQKYEELSVREKVQIEVWKNISK
jgi:hypothetical protein